jgi:hypothetical protein
MAKPSERIVNKEELAKATLTHEPHPPSTRTLRESGNNTYAGSTTSLAGGKVKGRAIELIEAMSEQQFTSFNRLAIAEYEKKSKSEQLSLSSENKPGLYILDDVAYCTLPLKFLAKDNIVRDMFLDLIEGCGWKLRSYAADNVQVIEDVSHDDTIGYWRGAFHDKYIRRKRRKHGTQLAATYAFAWRTKHFFNNSKNLGARALAKDNFFFGNNPTEKDSENKPVLYLGKKRFLSLFTIESQADAMFELYQKILRQIGLSNLSEEDFQKTIGTNLISFNEIISKYARTQTEKRKGKKKIIGSTMPNKPSQHPMLLRCESDLIERLVTPIWGNNKELSERWVSDVAQFGFSALFDSVKELYQRRWLILSKFAGLTTSRLKEVRKNDQKFLNTKKVDIPKEEIRQLILKRESPVTNFVTELSGMLAEHFETAVSMSRFKYQRLSKENSMRELKHIVAAEYVKEFSSEEKKSKEFTDTYPSTTEIEDIEYLNLMDSINSLVTKSVVIVSYLDSLDLFNKRKDPLMKVSNIFIQFDKFFELFKELIDHKMYRSAKMNFEDVHSLKIIDRFRNLVSSLKTQVNNARMCLKVLDKIRDKVAYEAAKLLTTNNALERIESALSHC